MATLNKKDIDKKNNVKYFNTMKALETVVDPTNFAILSHKAKTTVLVGAKDASKTWPVKAWEVYTMERDPMASTLALKKYQTSASKLLQLGTQSMLNYIFNIEERKNNEIVKPKYTSKYKWEPTVGSFKRIIDTKNKINNQQQFYGSFEGYNALAGLQPGNGGYFTSLHIEEPSEMGDTDTVDPLEWKRQIDSILDTIERARVAYSETQPHFEPLPFKVFITFNDWDEEHPESIFVQKYMPREKFINFAVGFDYNSLYNKVSDRIDGKNIVPELKEVIMEKWEEIKDSIMKNHTQMVYVEKDELGKKVDKLLVRKTKFSNVIAREGSTKLAKEKREEILENMKFALMTGNQNELAVLFGMVDNSEIGVTKRFNFKNMDDSIIDTDAKLKEPGREVLGFSMGWDHDANRGPYGTPATISAVKYNAGNPFEPNYKYTDWKVMIHPQVAIEGYGKGQAGENTELYHRQMIDISKSLKQKYVGNKKSLGLGICAVFDDDDGSYINKINKELIEDGYMYADAIESKNGKIETGGYGTESRDKMWEVGIDLQNILIDQSNTETIKYLKSVPIEKSGKRSAKGKFGKRLKDAINSAEYAIWVWRSQLFNMNN